MFFKTKRYPNNYLIEKGYLEIGDGYRAKNSEMDKDGLPFVRAGNIRDGFDFSNVDFLNKKSVEKAGNKVSKLNDCVITTKGSFGRVAYVNLNTPSFVYSPQLCYWRSLNADIMDSRYLFYWLQGPEFCAQAFQIKSSTDMADYASLTDQRAMSITLPEIKIQKKVAAILSAYDDLIENNNRRIAILEKMAEELYREWFVRLRFPGHEKIKITKGVPEGWEIKKIDTVVDRKGFGKIYRENELSTEGKVIVIDQSIKNFLGFYDGQPEHIATKDNPIIIFGDHSCKMQLMLEPFSLAENVVPFVGKEDMQTVFLFYLIHNTIETTEYKRHWTELINKEVYIPTKELRKSFTNVVTDNIIQVRRITAISRKLCQIRDRLLPRLMSGKIDVENLDIQFPASMMEDAVSA